MNMDKEITIYDNRNNNGSNNKQNTADKLYKKKKHKKKKRKIFILLFLSILTMYVIIGFCQTDLVVTNYTYHSKKLPADFYGYKIALISDLHNENFGTNQSKLINELKKAKPDMIALTGDIIDADKDDLAPVENLIIGATSIAPTYFVTGNHELDRHAKEHYKQLCDMFDKYGVVNLNNSSVNIKRGDSIIKISGQTFCGTKVGEKLPYADMASFNILLYHGCNMFDMICDHGYDIILSGHSHGGIIRLPFIGGLINNNGGLFPKYDGGAYTKNNCTMFASRGLGDASFPRFYNPPELVIITLQK